MSHKKPNSEYKYIDVGQRDGSIFLVPNPLFDGWRTTAHWNFLAKEAEKGTEEVYGKAATEDWRSGISKLLPYVRWVRVTLPIAWADVQDAHDPEVEAKDDGVWTPAFGEIPHFSPAFIPPTGPLCSEDGIPKTLLWYAQELREGEDAEAHARRLEKLERAMGNICVDLDLGISGAFENFVRPAFGHSLNLKSEEGDGLGGGRGSVPLKLLEALSKTAAYTKFVEGNAGARLLEPEVGPHARPAGVAEIVDLVKLRTIRPGAINYSAYHDRFDEFVDFLWEQHDAGLYPIFRLIGELLCLSYPSDEREIRRANESGKVIQESQLSSGVRFSPDSPDRKIVQAFLVDLAVAASRVAMSPGNNWSEAQDSVADQLMYALSDLVRHWQEFGPACRVGLALISFYGTSTSDDNKERKGLQPHFALASGVFVESTDLIATAVVPCIVDTTTDYAVDFAIPMVGYAVRGDVCPFDRSMFQTRDGLIPEVSVTGPARSFVQNLVHPRAVTVAVRYKVEEAIQLRGTPVWFAGNSSLQVPIHFDVTVLGRDRKPRNSGFSGEVYGHIGASAFPRSGDGVPAFLWPITDDPLEERNEKKLWEEFSAVYRGAVLPQEEGAITWADEECLYALVDGVPQLLTVRGSGGADFATRKARALAAFSLSPYHLHIGSIDVDGEKKRIIENFFTTNNREKFHAGAVGAGFLRSYTLAGEEGKVERTGAWVGLVSQTFLYPRLAASLAMVWSTLIPVRGGAAPTIAGWIGTLPRGNSIEGTLSVAQAVTGIFTDIAPSLQVSAVQHRLPILRILVHADMVPTLTCAGGDRETFYLFDGDVRREVIEEMTEKLMEGQSLTGCKSLTNILASGGWLPAKKSRYYTKEILDTVREYFERLSRNACSSGSFVRLKIRPERLNLGYVEKLREDLGAETVVPTIVSEVLVSENFNGNLSARGKKTSPYTGVNRPKSSFTYDEVDDGSGELLAI